ncbi:DNA replication complex GINS protein PSF1 [Fimicolochytrium jonesii]|uniref:DNA replication complex GINS protein PSF1 n=1 Tax=Fimicolochytrium jonesii TaxID=1396493 RepID=UPI0022FE6F24|nr:DNA replication complex GINS protein PSF1 [Fimicolochytrium jonesii]KAI8817043.1 DNA replication complex GINS protein PSF1 [Fimicolochytrium jonesii]
MYADDALKLVRDAKRTSDSPTLAPYRDDLIRNVQLEMRQLASHLRDIMSARESAPTPQHAQGLTVAATMHHLSLRRSKRCLLAYTRHRLDRITETLWDLGGAAASSAAAMPADLRRNLSPAEMEFVNGYTALVSSYRSGFLDVDMGAALVPPRDLFVEVRVLKDCGEVQTENGAVRLVNNSQHYLRRTDVEPFITAGYLRHIE